MPFDFMENERLFRAAWLGTEIVRRKRHTLFTFGDTKLAYYLVCNDSTLPGDEMPPRGSGLVTITNGYIRIRRPLILTLHDGQGPFSNFVEHDAEQQAVQFLLARTAQFSHLRIENERSSRRTVTDSVAAAVERLNRQLDDEEDEDTAILTAPHQLGGVALLRYTAEKVWESAPSNVQELRERGFLPD